DRRAPEAPSEEEAGGVAGHRPQGPDGNGQAEGPLAPHGCAGQDEGDLSGHGQSDEGGGFGEGEGGDEEVQAGHADRSDGVEDRLGQAWVTTVAGCTAGPPREG